MLRKDKRAAAELFNFLSYTYFSTLQKSEESRKKFHFSHNFSLFFFFVRFLRTSSSRLRCAAAAAVSFEVKMWDRQLFIKLHNSKSIAQECKKRGFSDRFSSCLRSTRICWQLNFSVHQKVWSHASLCVTIYIRRISHFENLQKASTYAHFRGSVYLAAIRVHFHVATERARRVSFHTKFHVSSNYTAFTSEMKIDASRRALDEKKFDLYHEKKTHQDSLTYGVVERRRRHFRGGKCRIPIRRKQMTSERGRSCRRRRRRSPTFGREKINLAITLDYVFVLLRTLLIWEAKREKMGQIDLYLKQKQTLSHSRKNFSSCLFATNFQLLFGMTAFHISIGFTAFLVGCCVKKIREEKFFSFSLRVRKRPAHTCYIVVSGWLIDGTWRDKCIFFCFFGSLLWIIGGMFSSTH